MSSSSGVKIDFSFTDLVLQYFSNPSEGLLNQICNHTVAKKVLSNAQISSPELDDIKEFWKNILVQERKKGEEHLYKINSCIAYIRDNTKTLLNYVKELHAYLPDDFVFDCTLYLEVGYDIGIVADGDALLNVGHEIFHKNKKELIYFAMHELHHVGYTHYNKLELNFSEVQTRDEFVKIIEKLTHLEGTATYSVKEIRERDYQLSFFDYEVLKDEEKRAELVREYFELYDKYKYSKDLIIEESDFETLEKMSGNNKRLWYVTGSHMAEEIDRKLGREELNMTIIEGPKTFFEKYLRE